MQRDKENKADLCLCACVHGKRLCASLWSPVCQAPIQIACKCKIHCFNRLLKAVKTCPTMKLYVLLRHFLQERRIYQYGRNKSYYSDLEKQKVFELEDGTYILLRGL